MEYIEKKELKTNRKRKINNTQIGCIKVEYPTIPIINYPTKDPVIQQPLKDPFGYSETPLSIKKVVYQTKKNADIIIEITNKDMERYAYYTERTNYTKKMIISLLRRENILKCESSKCNAGCLNIDSIENIFNNGFYRKCHLCSKIVCSDCRESILDEDYPNVKEILQSNPCSRYEYLAQLEYHKKTAIMTIPYCKECINKK